VSGVRADASLLLLGSSCADGFGVWEVECRPISFDSFGGMTVTRAVFYGTGVVRAHVAEKNSGEGLRVFVHSSITDTDLKMVADDGLLLPVDADAVVPRELNYLHPHDGMEKTAAQKDDMLRTNLSKMRRRLPESAPEKVIKQYTETVAALNRMRQQWSRAPFVW
jgi:hypothetical protein